MTRILVVEDQIEDARALRINLSAQHYEVTVVADPAADLRRTSPPPDLVIVDLGLPDTDGTEVIHELRGWTPMPIIVLSTQDTESDKVAALDAGADDYLTKPFGMAELLARIRAALRRAQPNDSEPVVATDAFTIDLAAKQITTGAGHVRLTPTEWRLLEILVRNPGRLMSRRQLLTEVGGRPYDKETSYLRVYMAQLRHKLEKNPAHPRHIVTEPGMGYRFEP